MVLFISNVLHRLLSVLRLSFSLTPVFFSLYFSSSFPFLSLSISPSSRIVLDRFPILQRNRMCLQDVPNWRLMLVFSQHSLAPFSRWETMPIRDSDFRTPLSRRYLHKQPAARWRTRESSVIYFINICGVQYTCQVWAHDFWLGVWTCHRRLSIIYIGAQILDDVSTKHLLYTAMRVVSNLVKETSK